LKTQNLPANVRTYLTKHADNKYKIEWKKQRGINNVIVIPAIAEFENIKIVLSSLFQNDPTYFKSTLVLFVINNSPSSDLSVKEDNLKSLEYLRSIVASGNEEEFFDTRLNLGLVDASSPGKELSNKDCGVGLARKVGMDSALTLFDYTTDEKKLIICLDADCTVQRNYLTKIVEHFRNHNTSVGLMKFEHQIDGTSEYDKAITCYEIFLRYYIAGLTYAKSCYAYQVIGSTMVCDHNAYIKAGGMNKNKAGEDFYFLEKLSKNFCIGKIDSTTVYPSGRSSWRVPFGTGKSVSKFLSNPEEEYFLYDPETFEILKCWLETYNSEDILVPEKLLENSKNIHNELFNFLNQQGFKEQWEKIISNTKSEKQMRYQQKIWFDSFKTLKLIHHLRDTAYPELNMFDALDKFFIKMNVDKLIDRKKQKIPKLDIQKEYLRILKTLVK
jgi:hypothetical protein